MAPGSRLGAYEVIALIGAGGMGQVYRARDTKLGREVALKVLPEVFAQDAERLARFGREARLLASLSHPGIATLHGLEESDGTHYLVMELVEGETLADRIARGKIPLAEAIPLFEQIAEALLAAHEKGIVHRDLKPSNIKITPEGKVKLLDFGLAKLVDTEPGAIDSSASPTLTRGTALGAILGTVAYMSPEQARGKSVDKRTDLWAFGCCLYETLTGRQVFSGETVADVIGAIVSREPDFGPLPALPPTIRLLLRRALEKDAVRRLRDAGDARVLLEESRSSAEAEPAPSRRGAVIVAGVALGVLVGAGVASVFAPDEVERPIIRFTIDRPELEGSSLEDSPVLALSPDGTLLAYVGDRSGDRRIYVRALGETEVRGLSGTEGAANPFFSPDGRFLGFVAGRKLKTIPVAGGTAQTLADAEANGATWGEDGFIVFSPALFSPLLRVAQNGGSPEPFTELAEVQTTDLWPAALPGGRGVLFTRARQDGSSSRILVKPSGREPKLLVESGTHSVYVPTGHLLYAQSGTILAAPFDLDRLELTSPPIPILEGVQQFGPIAAAQLSVSAGGTLAYLPGSFGTTENTLVWVHRNGREEPLPVPPRHYAQPRLSPDGVRVALAIGTSERNVWIYGLHDDALTRLTFDAGDGFPVWSPDGRNVFFQSNREGTDIFAKAADGSDASRAVSQTEYYEMPHSLTPDGATLALVENRPGTGTNLYLLSLTGETKLTPFLVTDLQENSPMFSPDGRYLAYRSNESGRDEVYVQPVPPTGAKWQVSSAGGSEAVWSRDGRELFYRNDDKMMAVKVTTGEVFSHGRPEILFAARYERTAPDRANYDVSLDGKRFLMVKPASDRPPVRTIEVVLNWAEELKRRVPLK